MKLYTVTTKNEIDFPDFCASCAFDTKDEILVDVTKPTGLSSLLELFIPLGGVLSGLKTLDKNHVKIKCCERCNKTFDYNLYSFLMFVLALLLFSLLFFFNVDKYQTIGMIIIASGTFLLFTCLIPYSIGKSKSSKVFVEYKSGVYIYRFENKDVFDKILELHEAQPEEIDPIKS